ncbi:beta-fructofuranosidase, insoluble isoenzyme CWINV6-like [Impatiens glandulifera]|uniref:beta-fructofuranosidase, insoluble isoenzyme CWINV6-like n=1 Tax=Impatiens glandulifera TaxID=253017 RepID=UPI001FB04DB3|nr:beta-fructofuranosidase, insoluble isoenzyme CWINV6-like [Impatiens glandulifera]
MWICVLQLHVLILLVLFCCKISCILDGSSSMEQKPNYRTSYHFQPPKNWMNDPNGPLYYKGVYHIFYQYNPISPVFGKISWAHSVSRDLINWVHLERMLDPTDSYDLNGCWSGSITILPGGEPTILYTGVDFNNSQVQNLAMPKNSSDPLLREWVKSEHNPLMIPVDELESKNFRDPTTAWLGPDGIWRVIIGGDGNAVLYKSGDFIGWTRSDQPLHSAFGKTGMWECPDFFPVSVDGKNGVDTSVLDGRIKHVLKASFEGSHDDYVIGSYEGLTDKFKAESEFMDSRLQMRYDYGKFYASKSFFDSAKSRRILWAWISESDGDVGAIEKGWAGLQSIPRTILLDKSGSKLVQWPVDEIDQLRSNEVKIRDKMLKGGALIEIENITASQADVEASFKFGNLETAEDLDEKDLVDAPLLCSSRRASMRGAIGPFGLIVLASEGLEEQTTIFFHVFKNGAKYVVLMCSDQSRSSLGEGLEKATYGAFVDVDPLHEEISLRTLVDGSIVESFGGGGLTCITARVYPKLAIGKEARLYIFNNGTIDVAISRMNAWSMKPAQFHESYSSQETDMLWCQHQFGFGHGVVC